MMISLNEIVSLLILTIAVGYIFSDFFRKPKTLEEKYMQRKKFDWKDLKYAALVAAPGVILHELGHKFVAIGFGLNAEFFIWPTGLVLGVVLKLLSSGFILLAPGYVSIAGATPFQGAVTAIAGPLVNAAIWVFCILFLKFRKNLSRNKALFFKAMGKLNMWLFLFNMIPFGPLDGAKVLSYIIGVF